MSPESNRRLVEQLDSETLRGFVEAARQLALAIETHTTQRAGDRARVIQNDDAAQFLKAKAAELRTWLSLGFSTVSGIDAAEVVWTGGGLYHLHKYVEKAVRSYCDGEDWYRVWLLADGHLLRSRGAVPTELLVHLRSLADEGEQRVRTAGARSAEPARSDAGVAADGSDARPANPSGLKEAGNDVAGATRPSNTGLELTAGQLRVLEAFYGWQCDGRTRVGSLPGDAKQDGPERLDAVPATFVQIELYVTFGMESLPTDMLTQELLEHGLLQEARWQLETRAMWRLPSGDILDLLIWPAKAPWAGMLARPPESDRVGTAELARRALNDGQPVTRCVRALTADGKLRKCSHEERIEPGQERPTYALTSAGKRAVVSARNARDVPNACLVESVEARARSRPTSTVAADRPDPNGYVAEPADPTAYVAQAVILAHHTPTAWGLGDKGLAKIVEDYATNRVRWTRPLGKDGAPRLNRRDIHLRDWCEYVRQQQSSGDATTDDRHDPLPHEIEQRKAAIRRANAAGK